MEVRKEYTVSFSREEVNKMAATVGYIYGLYYDFEKATCNIEHSEYSFIFQELNDCLGRAKEALNECYNIMTDYCES